jgi:hypothetical protein
VLSFKALLGAAAISALAALPAQGRTILFLGSSFTYGAHSAAQHYHPELVKDLNGPDLCRGAGDLQAVHPGSGAERL